MGFSSQFSRTFINRAPPPPHPYPKSCKIDFLMVIPITCPPLASVPPPPAPRQYTVKLAAVNPPCSPPRLLQPNNITVTVPTDLHDFLGMANPVLAVDGQTTNIECAHGQLALLNLQSSAPSYRSINSPRCSAPPSHIQTIV